MRYALISTCLKQFPYFYLIDSIATQVKAKFQQTGHQCSSRNVDRNARHDAMNCCPLPVIRACKCVHLPVRRLHLPPPPPPSFTSRCTRGFPSLGCDASPHFVYGGYVSRPWERLGVRHPFQVSQTSIIAAIETLRYHISTTVWPVACVAALIFWGPPNKDQELRGRVRISP